MNFRHGLTRINTVINGLLQMAGWLLFIAIWTWFGWLMGRCYEQREAASRYEIQDTRYIPSVEEQQGYLASEGYDVGEIDGTAGPKFCRAINRWQMDQWASETEIKNQNVKCKYAEGK